MRLRLILLAMACILVSRESIAGPADSRITTVEVPYAGAFGTAVTGLAADGTLVGAYNDAGARPQGFLREGRSTAVLLNVTPQAINTARTITGWFVSGHVQGFVVADGTFTPMNVSEGQPFPNPALLTEPLSLNDHGVIVGDYRSGIDHNFHGFVYDPTARTLTTVDWPGATTTSLTGINTQGDMVGVFFDAQFAVHGFVVTGGQLTEVQVSGIPEPDLCGITDDGTLAGNANDAGFVVRDGMVQIIAIPEAQLTELSGIRNDGSVYGRYLDKDGVDHGFVAMPTKNARKAEPRPAKARVKPSNCHIGSKRAVCRLHERVTP
jgi:hypothetical protein